MILSIHKVTKITLGPILPQGAKGDTIPPYRELTIQSKDGGFYRTDTITLLADDAESLSLSAVIAVIPEENDDD